MGLLDFLGSPEMRQGIGLLAAAGPSREPLSFGQRMSGFLQQQDAEKRAEEERRAKQQMQAMQMQQLQMQIAQQQQAAQKQAEQDAALKQFRGSIPSPQGQATQQALGGGGGPTNANAANMPRVDPMAQQMHAAMQAGLIDPVQFLQSQAPKQAKLKSVEPMKGPDGKMVNVALFEDGSHKILPYGVRPEIALQQLGDRVTAIDKNDTAGGTSFRMGNSPDALLGAQTTMRGQNMTDARAREKNLIDREAIGKVDWKQDVNGAWVGLPKEVSGQGPVSPVTTTVPGKREQQARNALDIINEAKPLIDQATGSYAGAGIDLAGRVAGLSTKGATAGAKLKALEGALMMAQPRMEGPQSDKDVQLYRQMAAALGDPTVPAAQKKAALATVEALHSKYAGTPKAASSGASLQDLLNKYGN